VSSNTEKYVITDSTDRQHAKQVKPAPLVYKIDGDFVLSNEGVRRLASELGIVLVGDIQVYVTPIGGSSVLIAVVATAKRGEAFGHGGAQALISTSGYDNFAVASAVTCACRNALRSLMTPAELQAAIEKYIEEGAVEELARETAGEIPTAEVISAPEGLKVETLAEGRRITWRDVYSLARELTDEPRALLTKLIRELTGGGDWLPDEQLPQLYERLKGLRR